MFKQKCSLVHKLLPIPERDCLLQRIIKIETKLADPPPESCIRPAEEAGMAADQGTFHNMGELSDRISGLERIVEGTSNHAIDVARDISTLKQQSAKMEDEYKATDIAIRNLEKTSVLSESTCVRFDGRIDACFALASKINVQVEKQEKEIVDKILVIAEKLSFLSDNIDNIKDNVAGNAEKLASLSDVTYSIKDKTQEHTDQLSRDNKSVKDALDTLHKRIMDNEDQTLTWNGENEKAHRCMVNDMNRLRNQIKDPKNHDKNHLVVGDPKSDIYKEIDKLNRDVNSIKWHVKQYHGCSL